MTNTIWLELVRMLPSIFAAIFAGVALIIAQRNHALGQENKNNIHELHIAVNSRLSELLAVTGLAKHAEGVLEGTLDGAASKATAMAAAHEAGVIEGKASQNTDK